MSGIGGAITIDQNGPCLWSHQPVRMTALLNHPIMFYFDEREEEGEEELEMSGRRHICRADIWHTRAPFSSPLLRPNTCISLPPSTQATYSLCPFVCLSVCLTDWLPTCLPVRPSLLHYVTTSRRLINVTHWSKWRSVLLTIAIPSGWESM